MKKPPENWPKNWRKKKHWNVRWLQFETSNLQEECRLDICRIFVKFSNVISILPYLLRSRMLPPDLSKRFRVKKMNTRLQWNQCCALQWSKNFIKSWCLFLWHNSFVTDELQVDGSESTHVGRRSAFMARAVWCCNAISDKLFNTLSNTFDDQFVVGNGPKATARWRRGVEIPARCVRSGQEASNRSSRSRTGDNAAREREGPAAESQRKSSLDQSPTESCCGQPPRIAAASQGREPATRYA